MFVIDHAFPREEMNATSSVKGIKSYTVVTRCARYVVVFPRQRDGSAHVTHVYLVRAREANLHANIFQENKSIRMREEELLKLVIAV